MSTVRDETHDLMRKLGMTTVFGNPGSTEAALQHDGPMVIAAKISNTVPPLI